jgi:hypothetical protein
MSMVGESRKDCNRTIKRQSISKLLWGIKFKEQIFHRTDYVFLGEKRKLHFRVEFKYFYLYTTVVTN